MAQPANLTHARRARPRGALRVARGLQHLMGFLQASPTAFHCVVQASRWLHEEGFVALRPEARFRIRRGQGYVIAHEGYLVAFRLGHASPEVAGVRMLAAHTDSPGLRVQPRVFEGGRATTHARIDVDVYGSPLLYTWLDRDLTLAGRVIVECNGRLVSQLVYPRGPVARIPSLAVHFQPDVNERGLVLDRQQHLDALLGADGLASVRKTISEQLLGTDTTRTLRGHDLFLVDTQPPALVGAEGQFLSGSRLDNLAMCHATLSSLIEAEGTEATQLVVLFDHEEIGSQTESGADGAMLPGVLERLVGGRRTAYRRMLARSTMLSADMGHAVHPGYADRHAEGYTPVLNGGPMLKTNVARRFGADTTVQAQIRKLAADLGLPLQEYAHHPNLACGATVGPRVAAQLGIGVADIGSPVLGMHSIRETAGASDHATMRALLRAYLAVD